MSKLNISELFGPTIQGEGIWTGHPSIFLRLNHCNLNCAFRNGSICDTPYTSYHPEHNLPPIEASELAEIVGNTFRTHPYVEHLVITGGEPMMQQKALIEFLDSLYNWYQYNQDLGFPLITIETNGTYIPSPALSKYINLWSVSPKLSTSAQFKGSELDLRRQDSHNRLRINLQALAALCAQSIAYKPGQVRVQLKFVWSAGEPELESEIKDLLSRIRIRYQEDYHTSENILDMLDIGLMPEGQTNEQINKSAQDAIEVCIKNGWTYWDRLHIRIWGDKRGV